MARLLAVYLLTHSEPLIIFSVLEKAFFFAFLTQIQLPVLSSSTGLAQIHSLSDVIKIGIPCILSWQKKVWKIKIDLIKFYFPTKINLFSVLQREIMQFGLKALYWGGPRNRPKLSIIRLSQKIKILRYQSYLIKMILYSINIIKINGYERKIMFEILRSKL